MCVMTTGTRSRTGRTHSARNLSSYFDDSKENGGGSSNLDSDKAMTHGSALKKPNSSSSSSSSSRTMTKKGGEIETRYVKEDRVESVRKEKSLAHRNVASVHQHHRQQVEEKSKSSDGGVFSTIFSPMYHLLNGAEEDAVEETAIVHTTVVKHQESSTKYVEFPSSMSQDDNEDEEDEEDDEQQETNSTSSGDIGSAEGVDLSAYVCDEQLPYHDESAAKAKQSNQQVDRMEEEQVEVVQDQENNMDKYCVSSTNYYSETTEIVEYETEEIQEDDGEMRLTQPYYLDEYDEFDPYWFIALLPPLSMAAKMRPACLPRKTRQSHPVTLVLDLDETLVHCSTDGMEGSDLQFPVMFNGVEFRVSAKIRPFMERFLQEVSKMFEVVVFTASKQVYADTLLDLLDPEHKYIKYRAFRDSCVEVEGNYLKDLTILGRDMSKTIIIDNSPHAYGFQIDNGIPIESWYDDMGDRELAKLLPFLRKCAVADDVRPLLRKQFRQRDLVNRYKKQQQQQKAFLK
eukprot:TRINITY_DN5296_c0_g1_i4.p1 TRINITY_DN5296_c0_g1~~TRINITY_DN5296_c0_g1_i4.p1  ORF type:complete len:514 (-),score=192.31 TRINITY_DN5296_c0_g1_i4:18-1559(-)